ncbi:MAG: hypothetical protein FVQ77_16000 [Cytophagales bacterium]|nr:hypothetical protein [Cytophagales bacterium]
MSTAQIKEKLHQYIDQGDESLIKKIYKLVKENDLDEIVGYAADRKPITKKDIIARAKQANEDIADGRVITQEDLEKEAENW